MEIQELLEVPLEPQLLQEQLPQLEVVQQAVYLEISLQQLEQQRVANLQEQARLQQEAYLAVEQPLELHKQPKEVQVEVA